MNLILHFDINGTITPIDTTEPGTNFENANLVIAKSIYGKVIDDRWVLNDQWYNETDSISYYNYLRKVTPRHKEAAYNVTNNGGVAEKFADFIPIIINSMESFLFPSFLKVLDVHKAKIIFRTFGLDADDVIKYLREKTDKFKEIMTGEFYYEDDIICLNIEDKDIIKTMENINDYYKNNNYNFALKENYNYWNKHKRSTLHGKQLLGSNDMIQIFFDDNNCVNVIDPKNSYFVKVNTLRALFDDNYYVDIINDIIKDNYPNL